MKRMMRNYLIYVYDLLHNRFIYYFILLETNYYKSLFIYIYMLTIIYYIIIVVFLKMFIVIKLKRFCYLLYVYIRC